MMMDPSQWTPGDPDMWAALARYITGECSAEEARAIDGWLDAEPDRRRLVESLGRAVAYVPAPGLPVEEVEAALARIRPRLDEPVVHTLPTRVPAQERPRTWWRTTAIRAAALVTVAVGGALLWREMVQPSPESVLAEARVYATEAGQTDSIGLPDGSRVLLAPRSRLTLAEGFGTASRAVTLEGVALFEVTHSEDRPFVVHAGDATIQDLGTTFTVRNEEGEEVQVAVTEGIVLLKSASSPADSVVLQPGDRGTAGTGAPRAERGAASDADHAWTTGRLVFENAPLQRVASDLRRWYGLELRLHDSALASRRITATFAGESREQVVQAIGLTLGADTQLRGDTAFVRSLPAGR